MGAHEPEYGIQTFRDRALRSPWVHIELGERLFQGQRVQPIAFNERDHLVLLHRLGDGVAFGLGVYQCDSLDGEFGELDSYCENIGHFIDIYCNA